MSDLDVRLFGGDADPESGLPRYDPGGVVRGVVQVRGGAGRGVYVAARWRTVGRGIADEGEGRRVRVHGPVADDQPVEATFEYRLPEEPWSYRGELVAIEWRLEACLDVPMAADRSAAAPFVLAPPPARPEEYPGAATAKQEGR